MGRGILQKIKQKGDKETDWWGLSRRAFTHTVFERGSRDADRFCILLIVIYDYVDEMQSEKF